MASKRKISFTIAVISTLSVAESTGRFLDHIMAWVGRDLLKSPCQTLTANV